MYKIVIIKPARNDFKIAKDYYKSLLINGLAERFAKSVEDVLTNQNDYLQQNSAAIVQKLKDNSFADNYFNQTPTQSPEAYSYCQSITNHCNDLIYAGKTKREIAVYLNSQVDAIIGNSNESLTLTQQSELIFLSTYKFSMYYWQMSIN